MAECERLGTAVCPSAETVRADWEYIHRELPTRDLTLDGNTVTYGSYVAAEISEGSWFSGQARMLLLVPKNAQALRAESAEITDAQPLTPEVAAKTWSALREAAARGSATGDRTEQTRPGVLLPPRLMQTELAVTCSETINPVDPTGIRRAANEQNTVKPGEGAARVWQGSACAQWPFRGKNAYRGDYRSVAASDVLLVSSEFDTDTPYLEGAVAMRKIFPGSRLVTVKNSFGTYGYFRSECARQIASDLLYTGKLPESDRECQPRRSLADELKSITG